MSAVSTAQSVALPVRGPASYLDELNPAQHAAVTFGVRDSVSARTTPPLLVIAGAGTGKTKTLAHRVAHLILSGADPRRILLLTFARRMAAEMTRRVEHICARALAGRAALIRRSCGIHRMVRNVSRGRRQAAPSARAEHRSRSGILDSRPQRCRRPDGPGARRAGVVRGEGPLSEEGDLPRHLLLRGQCADAAARGARRGTSRGAPNGRSR